MQVFIDYINLLEPHLKKSLQYYTTSEYKELNNSVRNNMIMSKEHREHYNNILDIFQGPILRNSITVYRGMTKRYKMFDTQGFISTSTNKEIAKSFTKGSSCCLYIITLTPGEYTILPLSEISDIPEEEVLLPPGDLSIQMIVPYTDPENKENVDIVYCTFIPNNAEIMQNNLDISEKFDKVKITLSTQSWVDRVLDSGIIDEIKLLCEDVDCILEQIQTLDFYKDIPEEAINKVVNILNNLEHCCF
jgi:hypothetical protein